MIKLLFPLCFFCISITSCNDETTGFDCESLESSLLDKDPDAIKALMDVELENFLLLDIDNNACLHDRNLMAIVDFINTNCGEIEATGYDCSLNGNNVVRISFESNGVNIEREILLDTPDNPPLSVVGVR